MSLYHLIANICKKTEAGESLKNTLYKPENAKWSKDIPAIRALVDTTLRNRVIIDNLINKTNLCNEIKFSEVWIARVLVAELVFGKKSYSCTDEISKKVYKYKAELKSLSRGVQKNDRTFVPRYCRINTLKCSKQNFHSSLKSFNYKLKEVGGKSELSYDDFLDVVRNLKKKEYVQDYHMSDLYIFHPKANLIKTHLYKTNLIILQDKASCLVAPLLAPTPGSLMIDLCAAPGFKTQHLSSISGSSGLILAIDINQNRYNILANTRTNYELSNVMTFNADALHIPEMATKCIEYVLLDAPCSGSGVVQNYDYSTNNRSNAERLTSLHNLQASLLRTALTKYTSARRIVYSTCSLNEEENEAVVEELLDTAEENRFTLVNLKNHLQDFDIGLENYKCGPNCIRLTPEQSCTNGFFIALFERTNPPNPTPRAEFYKSLNDIIDGIRCPKKRKADDTEINNEDDVDDDHEHDPDNENDSSVKQLNNDLSPKKEKNTNKTLKDSDRCAKEKEAPTVVAATQPFAKKIKLVDSTSDSDSSSDDDNEEEKKNVKDENKNSSAQMLPKEGNYIRVVNSSLLCDPALTPGEKKNKSDSDDDDDDDSSDSDNQKEINKPNTFIINKIDIKGNIDELNKSTKESSSDDDDDTSSEDNKQVNNVVHPSNPSTLKNIDVDKKQSPHKVDEDTRWKWHNPSLDRNHLSTTNNVKQHVDQEFDQSLLNQEGAHQSYYPPPYTRRKSYQNSNRRRDNYNRSEQNNYGGGGGRGGFKRNFRRGNQNNFSRNSNK